jgi:hypothetical protein
VTAEARVLAGHRVSKHVEPPALVGDAAGERRHGGLVGVVDSRGHAGAAAASTSAAVSSTVSEAAVRDGAPRTLRPVQ